MCYIAVMLKPLDLVTVAEIAAHLGHANKSTTRAWIKRHRLVAQSRRVDSGEKLYRGIDVLAAVESMPIGPMSTRLSRT